jgi:hypothetical protein
LEGARFIAAPPAFGYLPLAHRGEEANMDTGLGDVPLGLWLSVAVTILVVAWFLGEDAAGERRHRQLVWLERMLLWGVAFAAVAAVSGAIGFALWQWVT